MDIAEALVLAGCEGQTMEGVLVDVNPKNKRGVVQVFESAVELSVTAKPSDVGEVIRVRIDRVDVEQGNVKLTRVN